MEFLASLYDYMPLECSCSCCMMCIGCFLERYTDTAKHAYSEPFQISKTNFLRK